MSRLDERTVHGLRVVIDRDQCVGFGDCVTEAPEAFALEDDTVVAFVDPSVVERARLLCACNACPVDAITVYNERGHQIVPEPRRLDTQEPGGQTPRPN